MLEKHKDNAKQRWQVLQEITGKVQKKNKAPPTSLNTETKLYLIKILFQKNSTLFSTNIGPNLSNKIPQLRETFDQYFSPVDTQINHYDLSFESAFFYL